MTIALPATRKRFLDAPWRAVRREWSLGLVLTISLAERLAFLKWWKAFPGGDTYNFIIIAKELLRGSYPVAEKRLPVYPLLLILGHTATDWESAAVGVALVASLAAIVAFYALGRTLGCSRTSLVMAALPFQAVAPFLFQSIRGYADTASLAFMLAAIVTSLRAQTWRGGLLTGVLAGAASLTRFEGVLLIPVLAILALVRRPRVPMLVSAGAAILCWTPFLLLSTRAGRPFLPVEYFADAEGTAFGVTAVRDFSNNYAALWTSVGLDRLWKEPLRLLRDSTTTPLSKTPSRLWSFLSDPKEAPSLLMLVGLAALGWTKRGRAVRALLPFLAVAAPIAWWGVRQRFLIPLYPVPFLLLAAGADVLLNALRKYRIHSFFWRFGLPWTAAVGMLALAAGPWRANNAAEARELQAKNWGKDYAYYQAIEAARGLPGVIAFEHRSSIALALFGEPDQGRAVFADTHLDSREAAAQWEQLSRWRVNYVVIPGRDSEAFPVLAESPFQDRFAVTQSFTFTDARRRVSEATIFRVRP